MKKILMTAAAVVALAAPAFADPLEGVWQTQPDDGAFAHITISPCGGDFCGVISRAFDTGGNPIESANIGRRIVWDMTPAGGGAYEDGTIWRPADGKEFRSKMALSGNQLDVSGCVLGGIICKSQTWSRVQ